jgi:hypothetical protein
MVRRLLTLYKYATLGGAIGVAAAKLFNDFPIAAGTIALCAGLIVGIKVVYHG